jgi:hypothetical protein
VLGTQTNLDCSLSLHGDEKILFDFRAKKIQNFHRHFSVNFEKKFHRKINFFGLGQSKAVVFKLFGSRHPYKGQKIFAAPLSAAAHSLKTTGLRARNYHSAELAQKEAKNGSVICEPA